MVLLINFVMEWESLFPYFWLAPLALFWSLCFGDLLPNFTWFGEPKALRTFSVLLFENFVSLCFELAEFCKESGEWCLSLSIAIYFLTPSYIFKGIASSRGELSRLPGIGVGEFEAMRLAILICLIMSFEVGRVLVVYWLLTTLTPCGTSIDTLQVCTAVLLLACFAGFGLVLGLEAFMSILVGGDCTLIYLGAVICIRAFWAGETDSCCFKLPIPFPSIFADL